MKGEPLIRMRGVSKYYEDGKVAALSDISLEVKEGEFIVIKGPSGSGKSTLLHLIGGLDSPDAGEVFFKGKNAKDAFKERFFRINNVGFVFQAFYLWPVLNVTENVLLPMMEIRAGKTEKEEVARRLIDDVGLSGKYFSRVKDLSMGERQRVAIARALVNNPSVLLADEPTGSLDSKNAENILGLFGNINKKRNVTVIVVTHERFSYGFFDRTVEMLDGKIIV